MKISKICIVCGKEFIKSKSCGLPEWQTRKFCSKFCVNKGRTPWNKDKKTGLIPKTAFKKGEFRHPETAFKKVHKTWNKDRAWTPEERKKISDSSYWKGKTGEFSPNWKGGTTKLGQLIRSQRMYYHWRNDVFQRDNYTCQHCGAKRSKGNRVVLHCDHIKPFYKILEENQIKTVEQAKECKELWDIANGRTLCIPCHKQTPSYLVNQHTM